MGAIMDSIRRLLSHNLTTIRALLTGIVRLYFRQLLAGTCSLALQLQSKGTPPHVRDTLGKIMVLEHVLDFQIFYSHFIATFKDAMRRLKLEILALIRYPLMAACDDPALFRPAFAAFVTSKQYALMFPQFALRFAVMSGVGDTFTVRIYNKRVQSNINAERRFNRDFNWIWNFNNDCGIPTGRLLGDGQRLNFTIGQRSVVSNLQVADFRDNHTGVFPTDIANQLLCQQNFYMRLPYN